MKTGGYSNIARSGESSKTHLTRSDMLQPFNICNSSMLYRRLETIPPCGVRAPIVNKASLFTIGALTPQIHADQTHQSHGTCRGDRQVARRWCGTNDRGLLQRIDKKMVPVFASVIISHIPDVPDRGAGCWVLRI